MFRCHCSSTEKSIGCFRRHANVHAFLHSKKARGSKLGVSKSNSTMHAPIFDGGAGNQVVELPGLPGWASNHLCTSAAVGRQRLWSPAGIEALRACHVAK